MSSKDRQRALARTKLERQMAKRAAAARKRRQIIAGISALVGLVVIATGTVWLVQKYSGNEKKTDDAVCSYQDVGDTTNTKDVGKPSADNVPRNGERTATIETNFGTLSFTMNLAKVPCTGNSWEFLASKQFYDNTSCPRMTAEMVQCGNPFGDSEAPLQGGPTYGYDTENLPVNMHPPYTKGTVAMAKSAGPTGVGSQFFIMLADSEAFAPDYTVVGRISQDQFSILDAIAAVGNDGSFDPPDPTNPDNPENLGKPGGGKPNQPVTLTSVRVE